MANLSREQEIALLDKEIARRKEIEALDREIQRRKQTEDKGFFSNFGRGLKQGFSEDIPRQTRILSQLAQGKGENFVPEPMPKTVPLEFSRQSIGHNLGRSLGAGAANLGGTIAGAGTGATIGTMINPGIGTVVGGLIGGGVGGGVPAGLQELADFYNEARTNGLSHEDALSAAKAAGFTTAAINALGVGLGGIGGKALAASPLKQALPYLGKQMGIQGALGGADTAAKNLIAKETEVDPSRDILHGVPESALLSSVAQGIPTAATIGSTLVKGLKPKKSVTTVTDNVTHVTDSSVAPHEPSQIPVESPRGTESFIGSHDASLQQPILETNAANSSQIDIELTKKKIFGEEKQKSWIKDALESTKSFFKHPLSNLEYYGFDNLVGAKLTGKQLGFKLDAENIPLRSAKYARNLNSSVEAALTQGAPYLDKAETIIKLKPDSKGFLQILEPITQSKEMLDDFQAYSYGRRVKTQELVSKGKEKNISQAEAESLVGLENKYPEFKPVFEELQEYKKSLTDLLEECGVINKEDRAKWEQMDHIPFYRADKEGNIIPLYGAPNKLAGQKSPIKALTGGENEYIVIGPSGEQLGDRLKTRTEAEKLAGPNDVIHEVGPATSNLFDNMAKNIAVTIETAYRNQAANTLVDAGLKAGIVKPVERPIANKNETVVNTLRDGKKQHFEVEEPLLFSALNETMTPRARGGKFLNSFEWMKNLVSKSIVINPTVQFSIALKDIIHSNVIGKNPMPGLIGQVKNVGSAYQHYFRDRPDIRAADMMAMGAYSSYSNNRPKEVTQRLYDMAAANNPTKNSIIMDPVLSFINPKVWFENLEKLGKAAELSVRLSKYDAAKKAGLSPAGAGYEALDYMDYKNRGAAPPIQLMGQTVPFMFTHLAGLYKFGREISHNNFINRTTKMASVIGGAALTNAYFNSLPDVDEEDAAEGFFSIPQEQRDAYFIIDWHKYLGKKATQAVGLPRYFKYPKPWELGVIAVTIPENFMYSAMGAYGASEGLSKSSTAFRGALQIDPFGQPLVKTLYEQGANRKSFTDIPIVPRSRENLEPELQYGPGTSPVAKAVGKEFNLSPDRLQHGIEGMIGTAYLWPLYAADIMIRNAPGKPEKPETHLTEQTFINKFFINTPLKRSGYESEFYDLYKEADRAYKTFKRYYELQDVEELKKYTEEHKNLIGSHKALTQIKDSLSQFNDVIQQIENSPNLDSKEKRKELDNIYHQRNLLLYRFHKMKKDLFHD